MVTLDSENVSNRLVNHLDRIEKIQLELLGLPEKLISADKSASIISNPINYVIFLETVELTR